MNNSISKLVGRGLMLQRYGSSKNSIVRSAVGSALATFFLMVLLPGGFFFGDLAIGAVTGEAVLLVAASKDFNRNDTLDED